MHSRIITILPLTGLATLALSTMAQAQDTSIAQLEQRITELEQQSPQLSFGVPGVDLTVYGYVKADFIYDLDADLGSTFFGITSADLSGDSDDNFRAQALQSRLGIRAAVGGANARIEGDFFGTNGAFRLRHADVNVGGFTFGQTWTNFMPIESYPSTLDFQGPAGITFARLTQARYTQDFGSGLGGSVSIEQAPGSDAVDPAFTAAATYTTDQFFVKLAGLGRNLETATGNVEGWGVNLSGNAQLWDGGTVNASYTTGEAIGSYFVYGGEDVFDGDAVGSDGITVGVSQDLGDNFNVGIVYGLRENDEGAGTDIESLETVHLTASYDIAANSTIGVEYITGERTLFNDDSDSADRAQVSVQFNF